MENPETEIDGITYRLTLWPTSKALDWKERLGVLGLEPIGRFLSTDTDFGQAHYDDVARLFLERLRGSGGYRQTLQGLLELVRRVKDDGTEVSVMRAKGDDAFEAFYRGRTMHLDRVAMWVVLENFRDFGDVVGWIVRALPGLLSKKSKGSADDNENEPEESPQETTPSSP